MPRSSREPAHAVLFDAAGTLIELREPVGETYARFARERGASLSAWRLDDAFRRVLRDAPPLVFPEVAREEIPARERAAWHEIVRRTFLAADSGVRIEDLGDAFDALFAHFGGGAAWIAREGAAQALRALRAAGVATAVVSNFDHRLHAILADLSLADAIDLVWLPSDAGVAKPDPAIFLGALDALGVAPERALVVGDDAVRDIAGAASAGLRAVDVGSLATLAELPALFEREIAQEPTR